MAATHHVPESRAVDVRTPLRGVPETVSALPFSFVLAKTHSFPLLHSPRPHILSLRNAAFDNPAAGFLQSILTTELAYTTFTNVFASFAAASVQDFSQSLSNEGKYFPITTFTFRLPDCPYKTDISFLHSQGAVASEWVIDGETNLDNVLASELVYGGAWGFEQFYGFGFEISGSGAAAIQQSLQATWIDENDPEQVTRRKLLSHTNQTKAKPSASTKEKDSPTVGEPLSEEDAKRRNMPPGAKLMARVRKPLDGVATRVSVKNALERRKKRKLRRKLLGGDNAEDADAENVEAAGDTVEDTVEDSIEDDSEVRSDSGIDEVTGEDIGDITSNWFDSFPAALPQSIRDRLLAQLEEFVLDPQIAISLEIAIALVGVVEPGVGIVSAEAADETTLTYDLVLHGYDASIDVAASTERAYAVAASASAGVAVAEAIVDASEIIDAVTDIVNEANDQVAADLALREAGGVTAQGSTGNTSVPKVVAARNRAGSFMNLATASSRTGTGKIPNRDAAMAPVRVSAQGAGAREAQGPAEGRDPSEPDYFGGTDYDYEPFGAISGTYAVAVSLIFLEQISLNGGSITII
tara:strand:- start:3909 stop:5651 length:1743 start_codon:yes stop_codon:yes gene_type:complete